MNKPFRSRRKAYRHSQRSIAEAARLSQADVSRIEAGGWVPPSPIQERLARVLETTPRDLFSVALRAAQS